MVNMVSYGANFVKIYDDDEDVYLTFKCKENVILNDRVVEEAKSFALSFVECSDILNLYALHKLGWYLDGITNV